MDSAITPTIGIASIVNLEFSQSALPVMDSKKKADWADLKGLPVLLTQVVDIPSFSTISLYLLRTVTSVTRAVLAISS